MVGPDIPALFELSASVAQQPLAIDPGMRRRSKLTQEAFNEVQSRARGSESMYYVLSIKWNDQTMVILWAGDPPVNRTMQRESMPTKQGPLTNFLLLEKQTLLKRWKDVQPFDQEQART